MEIKNTEVKYMGDKVIFEWKVIYNNNDEKYMLDTWLEKVKGEYPDNQVQVKESSNLVVVTITQNPVCKTIEERMWHADNLIRIEMDFMKEELRKLEKKIKQLEKSRK